MVGTAPTVTACKPASSNKAAGSAGEESMVKDRAYFCSRNTRAKQVCVGVEEDVQQGEENSWRREGGAGQRGGHRQAGARKGHQLNIERATKQSEEEEEGERKKSTGKEEGEKEGKADSKLGNVGNLEIAVLRTLHSILYIPSSIDETVKCKSTSISVRSTCSIPKCQPALNQTRILLRGNVVIDFYCKDAVIGDPGISFNYAPFG